MAPAGEETLTSGRARSVSFKVAFLLWLHRLLFQEGCFMKLIKLGFTMPTSQVSPQTLKDFWQPRSALQTRDMSQCLSLAKVTTLFVAECRGALWHFFAHSQLANLFLLPPVITSYSHSSCEMKTFRYYPAFMTQLGREVCVDSMC